MADQRRMRRVGTSWIIPVSREVRRHLKVTPPAQLYWHLAGPREAVLTPHPQRVGGKPAGIGLAKDLAAARAEIERLKERLAARPVRAFNQGASMGAAHVLRQSIPIEGDLAAIMDRLDRIESTLAQMPWARHRRRGRGGAPSVAPVDETELLESGRKMLAEYVTEHAQESGPRGELARKIREGRVAQRTAEIEEKAPV